MPGNFECKLAPVNHGLQKKINLLIDFPPHGSAGRRYPIWLKAAVSIDCMSSLSICLQLKNKKPTVGAHSFADTFSSSFFARSLRSLRIIFPEGFLGITSTKTTPPTSRLWRATRLSMNCIMSSLVTLVSGFCTT